MLLFKKVEDLQNHLSKIRGRGESIGFVPTMGALHRGHLSLIEKSMKMTGVTVCSIFVNPTQFNDSKDLLKYPRTTGADIEVLAGADCDVLFLPPVEEIYPDGTSPITIDFGYLDQPMEGAHRPGHFMGMAQVVKRLLDIVAPNQLFMGQKDYQQAAIVRNMIDQLKLSAELVVCPIVREESGLAMSSRNARLSSEQLLLAPEIFQTLKFAKANIDHFGPREIEKMAMERLSRPGMEPEYFEIVDGTTLKSIHDFNEVEIAVACTAVKVGEIRLIDNLILINHS